ncbi:MAG: hypothetical protein Q7S99_16240 [Parvibaculum sp.]|nr:hypothetical protein [Parvibaculum sp.]|tara:strand:- start:44 stop:358 length:315 start_codon:yes stop_codon:yes gene_type:complete
MSDSNPPEFPRAPLDPNATDEDQQLAAETLPILAKVHSQVAQGLLQMEDGIAVLDLVKSVFDGALYAHDRARTQDWPKLESQLESIAADAIMSLILLRRRHVSR